MSLKSNQNMNKFSSQEIQERRFNHLFRTILEMGYEEIKKTEYHRINLNPDNYPKTARFGFKYFKKKEAILTEKDFLRKLLSCQTHYEVEEEVKKRLETFQQAEKRITKQFNEAVDLSGIYRC